MCIRMLHNFFLNRYLHGQELKQEEKEEDTVNKSNKGGVTYGGYLQVNAKHTSLCHNINLFIPWVQGSLKRGSIFFITIKVLK